MIPTMMPDFQLFTVRRLKCAMVSALFLLALSGNATAQACNESSLPQTPGVWKESMKGSGSLPPKERAEQAKVFAAFYSMLKQNYSPLGMTVSQGGSLYSRASGQLPDSYIYSVYFLPFYCQGAATKTETDTPTVLYIHVNQSDLIFSKSATERYFLDEADRANYGWLRAMPDRQNGALHFNLAGASSQDKNALEDKWMLSYDGKLPYRYVSRQEYLDDSARLYAMLKDKELKKIALDFKDSPPQQREKILAATRQHIEGQLAVIERLSKSIPATDLQLPAIVSTFEEFKGFLSEGERGAVILIKDNPGYYNRQLPSSAPQLITVVFKSVTTRPVHARAHADALKAIDFTQLKNMLAK